MGPDWLYFLGTLLVGKWFFCWLEATLSVNEISVFHSKWKPTCFQVFKLQEWYLAVISPLLDSYKVSFSLIVKCMGLNNKYKNLFYVSEKNNILSPLKWYNKAILTLKGIRIWKRVGSSWHKCLSTLHFLTLQNITTYN